MIYNYHVKEIITNPIYVGIGDYPKIIEDEVFAEAGVISIEKAGIKNYFDLMFENLERALGEKYPGKKKVIASAEKTKDMKKFLLNLLNTLRQFYDKNKTEVKNDY